MTQVTPETEKKLQQGFKQFNKFMLLMWRLRLFFFSFFCVVKV